MALYSVWDYPRNLWAIYSTPTPVSVGDDPIPPRPARQSILGASPDVDVKPLPAGAKFIGYQHFASGEVRRRGDGFTATGDDAGTPTAGTSQTTTFLLGAGAGVLGAWLLWKVL